MEAPQDVPAGNRRLAEAEEDRMGRIPEGLPEEGGYKSPSVNFIWPHHRKMARLVASGLRPGEVATITGFSLGQISRIMGSPFFQMEVARIEGLQEEDVSDIRMELRQMSLLATENLEEDLRMPVRTNQDRQVRQKASRKRVF